NLMDFFACGRNTTYVISPVSGGSWLPTRIPVGGLANGAQWPSVSAGHDFDRDGFNDIALGTPWANGDRGDAYVYSPTDGKLLATLKPPAAWPGKRFGVTIALLPDVNGDGVV